MISNRRIIHRICREITITIIVILLVLAPALGYISYLDELIALFSIGMIIYRYRKLNVNKNAKSVLRCLAIMVVLGLLSNVISKLDRTIFPVLLDAFGVVKNHVIFLAVVFCMTYKTKNNVFKKLVILSRLFVIISFICGIINLLTQTPWTYDLRGGIRSFKFFYSNPASLGQAMMVSIAVFDYDGRKRNNLFRILALVVMGFTMRSGVIAIVTIYVTLYFVSDLIKKIRWYHIVFFVALAALVGWSMIEEYFISKNTLRFLLLQYGFITCMNYLPFGAGFATYGSQTSYDYYSPLYYKYGFNNIWGVNFTNGNYINDNYWPMIMAELGILGVFINLYLFYNELRIVLSNIGKNNYRNISIVLFISLMISTVGSANVTGVSGTLIFFVLGMLLHPDKKENVNGKIQQRQFKRKLLF